MLRGFGQVRAIGARALQGVAARRLAVAAGASRVVHIGEESEYNELVAPGSGRKAVLYFTASWCPPCKRIAPLFDELSTKFEDLDFAKIDIDELDELAARAGIRSVPTFLFFSDGKYQKPLSFSGADFALLESNIEALSQQ